MDAKAKTPNETGNGSGKTDFLPAVFLETMRELLGGRYDAYLDSFSYPVRHGLRVNMSKISPECFLEMAPFRLERIPWVEDGFFFDGDERPALHPFYAAGLYYLQEPSAMTPADRLPVESGDRVLDLCAAPGGKATKLAGTLRGSGMLFANDISVSRAKGLLRNLELAGAPNICVMSENPETLAACYPEYFDRILVDAPCSGEGMFRKNHRMTADWEARGPAWYAPLQYTLLEQACSMLKPGGMLMYSTCTFSPVEDEENVSRILAAHPELQLCGIRPYSGFCGGVRTNAGTECGPDADTEQCVRIYPHEMAGEGHFLALFRKQSDEGGGKQNRKKADRSVTDRLPEDAGNFLAHVRFSWTGTWHRKGDQILRYPDGFAPVPGIRYLRTGLLAGVMKGNRFIPSQALAMTLSADDFDQVVSFHPEDERVVRYLRGESPDIPDLAAGKGWHLVCVGNYPLGWGRVQNQRLKNHYQKGWILR